MNFEKKIEKLYNQQIVEWNLLAENIKDLACIKHKVFNFDGIVIRVQHNPKRIKSAVAKTDKVSISQRICFLCSEHRPPEQKEVEFGNYEILCNPYPIFKQHFTISHKQHIPQSIENSFSDLLILSKELPNYVVFYNGANCGASAPDHLHFQACPTYFLNIMLDYQQLIDKLGEVLYQKRDTKVIAINDNLRTFISIEANSKIIIGSIFKEIYYNLLLFTKKLPMINLLSTYDRGWKLLIFLRKEHRPSQFFELGEKQILFSPGAVDMGGVLVFPRKEDIEKITLSSIADMLQQVSFVHSDFRIFAKQVADRLKK